MSPRRPKTHPRTAAWNSLQKASRALALLDEACSVDSRHLHALELARLSLDAAVCLMRKGFDS